MPLDAPVQQFSGNPLDTLVTLCNLASNAQRLSTGPQVHGENDFTYYPVPTDVPAQASGQQEAQGRTPNQLPEGNLQPQAPAIPLLPVGVQGTKQSANDILGYLTQQDKDLRNKSILTIGTFDDAWHVAKVLARDAPHGPIDLEKSFVRIPEEDRVMRVPVQNLAYYHAMQAEKGKEVGSLEVQAEWGKGRTGS